jgi:hypothetical protein
MKNSKYYPSWIDGLTQKKRVISRHAESHKNIFLKEKKNVEENQASFKIFHEIFKI